MSIPRYPRYPRLAKVIYQDAWMIAPGAHETVRHLFEARLRGAGMPGAVRVEADRDDRADGDDDDGVMRFSAPPVSEDLGDGLTAVRMEGIMGRRLSMLERVCGGCDTGEVAGALRAADADPDTDSVLLIVDSPGGTVEGTPELADVVAGMEKPVIAFTEGQMDSAAYLVASQADLVYISKSGETGSIGVYRPVLDQSVRYAMQGLFMDLVVNRGGDFKGAGYPGTSLTDAQREEFQRDVDETFEMFRAYVDKGRSGRVREDAMRGQTFMGTQAVTAGLADSVLTLDDAAREARAAGRLAALGQTARS